MAEPEVCGERDRPGRVVGESKVGNRQRRSHLSRQAGRSSGQHIEPASDVKMFSLYCRQNSQSQGNCGREPRTRSGNMFINLHFCPLTQIHPVSSALISGQVREGHARITLPPPR